MTSPLFKELDLEIGIHQSRSVERLENTVSSKKTECVNFERLDDLEKKSVEYPDEEKSSWLDIFLKGNETGDVGVVEAKDAASSLEGDDGLIAAEDFLHVTDKFIESILGHEHEHQAAVSLQESEEPFQSSTDHQPASEVISANPASAEKESSVESQDTQQVENESTSGSILDEKLREEILAESLQPIVVVQQQQRVSPNNNVPAPVTSISSQASRRLSEVTNICLSILETANGERSFLKNHFPEDRETINDDHDDLEMSVSPEPDGDPVPLYVPDPDDPSNSNEHNDVFTDAPEEAGVPVEAETNDQEPIENTLEDFAVPTAQEEASHQESEQQNPAISSSSKCQDPLCEGHGKTRGQKRKSFSGSETSPLSDGIPRKKFAGESEPVILGNSVEKSNRQNLIEIPNTTFVEVVETLNCDQSEIVDPKIEKKVQRRGLKRKMLDTKEIRDRPKRLRKSLSAKPVTESRRATNSSKLSKIWSSKRVNVTHSQAFESFARTVEKKTIRLLKPILKGYACTHCRFKTTLKKAFREHLSGHHCHSGNNLIANIDLNTVS